MNRKERLRSEMGVDTPKKKKEAYAPIFYVQQLTGVAPGHGVGAKSFGRLLR